MSNVPARLPSEPPDVAPHAGDRRGDYAHQERPGHRQQRQRHKEQDARSQERADREVEVEAPIGDRLAYPHRYHEVKRRAQDGPIKPRQPLRRVRQPPAHIVATSQGNQRHGDLRRPNEVR